jgi:hypothetical protein
VKKLCYFGGNLSSGAGDIGQGYLDLEDFLLEATLNMGQDSRVTQCFLTWLIKYGIILSPSKLRRLLKQGREVDHAVLGAFVDILEANNRQKKHWKIIRKFVHKAKGHLLFPQLPPPLPNKANPYFLKYGIRTYMFQLDESKYVQPAAAILNSCPEIKYRAMGTGIPAADLRSFHEKHPDIRSVYEIAKRTHHPRTSIYLSYRMFEELGTLSERTPY